MPATTSRPPRILLCESDGTAEEVAEEIARMTEVMRGAGATEIRVSRDEAERLRFWAGRKAAFPAVGRISPDYYCMDGTIPRGAWRECCAHRRDGAEVRPALRQRLSRRRRQPAPADPVRRQRPGRARSAPRRSAARSSSCASRSAAPSPASTASGVEKINQMCVQFTAEELERFHAVKRAFDPTGCSIPARPCPTLHRCAEFGRHARARRRAAVSRICRGSGVAG